ncbi:MAG: gluconeogenesis factor YvcK family protein [Patescibacteria group bacterium]
MPEKQKHFVVVGGGTGTSVVLDGLKNYHLNLSAIVTTADDGSSSGDLRRKFRMIPPGDVRQCLVALASGNFGYLNERFQKGFLQGHTLGNLLITLFYQKNGGNFQEAVDELLRLTGASGSIIPMTLNPVTLVAELRGGRKLVGESKITSSLKIGNELEKLYLIPRYPKANERAIAVLKNADAIVVGPGNLFSSIIPNFLVNGIKKAFLESCAKKIYIANIFTQPGHTDNFTIADFLAILEKYIGKDVFSHIVYNTKKIPKNILNRHTNDIIKKQIFLRPPFLSDPRFVGGDIVSLNPRVNLADPIAKIRNPFLHDPKKLAKVLVSLV